jgi:hypothetical protein
MEQFIPIYLHNLKNWGMFDDRRMEAEMSNREGIGIGGVMAEVAWLSASPGEPVAEESLREGLRVRFDASDDSVDIAIKLAESCGVVRRVGNNVFLKHRPQ